MGKKKLEKQRCFELSLCRQDICQLQNELRDAYARFASTNDSDALDACIYEIGALRSRCNAAIKHYRQRYYTD